MNPDSTTKARDELENGLTPAYNRIQARGHQTSKHQTELPVDCIAQNWIGMQGRPVKYEFHFAFRFIRNFDGRSGWHG